MTNRNNEGTTTMSRTELDRNIAREDADAAVVSETMARLASELGCAQFAVSIDYGPDGLISIVDEETSEIMGAGSTVSEALEDVIDASRDWRTDASQP